jgi:hypothetical protein
MIINLTYGRLNKFQAEFNLKNGALVVPFFITPAEVNSHIKY